MYVSIADAALKHDAAKAVPLFAILGVPHSVLAAGAVADDHKLWTCILVALGYMLDHHVQLVAVLLQRACAVTCRVKVRRGEVVQTWGRVQTIVRGRE